MDQLRHFLAPLDAYPHWFVLLCFAVAAAGAGWLLMKMLKWAAYLVILVVVLVAILAVVIWLLG